MRLHVSVTVNDFNWCDWDLSAIIVSVLVNDDLRVIVIMVGSVIYDGQCCGCVPSVTTAWLAQWLRCPPPGRQSCGSIPAFSAGFFFRSNHTSDLKMCIPVATLLGDVVSGTGWTGVCMLWLGEVESWICNSSVWQHVELCEQIRPWDTLACCWNVEQPTNQPNKPYLTNSFMRLRVSVTVYDFYWCDSDHFCYWCVCISHWRSKSDRDNGWICDLWRTVLWLCAICNHRLVGPVVKVSTTRPADLRFDSHFLRRDFCLLRRDFSRSSHTSEFL